MSRAFPIQELGAKALRRIGLDVRRIAPSLRESLRARLYDGIDVKTVLDVGAHVGESAAEFATRFPGADVYCFEPFAASAERIRKRFAHDSRIRVHELALAEAPGVRELRLNEHTDMNSLLSPSTAPRSRHLGGATDEVVSVKVSTLDAFRDEHSLGRIGLLKIDVEGAELLCLQGARRTLAAGAVDVVYVEVGFAPRFEGEPAFWDVGQFMSGLGYALYDLPKLKRAPNGQLRVADAVFARWGELSRAL